MSLGFGNFEGVFRLVLGLATLLEGFYGLFEGFLGTFWLLAGNLSAESTEKASFSKLLTGFLVNWTTF